MVRYSNEHNWFSLTPVGMTYELKYRHQSTGARNQSWKPARVTWALVIAGDWLFQSETPPTYSLQDNTVHYSLEKKSEIPRKSADTMAGIVMKMIFICCFQSFCIFSKGAREDWKVDFRGLRVEQKKCSDSLSLAMTPLLQTSNFYPVYNNNNTLSLSLVYCVQNIGLWCSLVPSGR